MIPESGTRPNARSWRGGIVDTLPFEDLQALEDNPGIEIVKRLHSKI